jgi:hypothetical protein
VNNKGAAMATFEVSSKISSMEPSAVRPSTCLACQNKNNCRAIAATFEVLRSEQSLKSSTPLLRKKFALVADHLRREGFSFPNVRDSSLCWLYQKFGVAMFYKNQLLQLAEKIKQSQLIPEPAVKLIK